MKQIFASLLATFLLTASNGAAIPANLVLQSTLSTSVSGNDVRPYTPGVGPQPAIAHVILRTLRPFELTEAVQAAAILGNPNRVVFHPRPYGLRGVLNALQGGNGEAVGMFTASTFAAQGSVTNMGVQPSYTVSNGDLFFHTHQFVNNQCFEYGINYSYASAYLFGYNWCTGGNTPQGFMVAGLVGPAGGAIKNWPANGNGDLIAWDPNMGIWEIALEEVLEKDGAWHLLGYNWTTKLFVDLMNGQGVTGTKSACCGWSVFEEHGSPGSSCDFDPAFPKGTHLIYDEKKQVYLNGVWNFLDKVPSGGWSYGTAIDCANLTNNLAGYVSPYFSGSYFPVPTNSTFGAQHTGDWWLTQR